MPQPVTQSGYIRLFLGLRVVTLGIQRREGRQFCLTLDGIPQHLTQQIERPDDAVVGQ